MLSVNHFATFATSTLDKTRATILPPLRTVIWLDEIVHSFGAATSFNNIEVNSPGSRSVSMALKYHGP